MKPSEALRTEWKELLIYYLLITVFTIMRFIDCFILTPYLKIFKGKNTSSLPPICNPILLKSATNLANEIREGKIRSIDVVQAFIHRIKQVNPILNAVVEAQFEESLQEAKKVDLLLSKHCNLSQLAKEKPLLGVPVTIKEQLAVKGFHCTLGLLDRRDIICANDSFVVSKIRQMGAIIIGTTNIPELCFHINTDNLIYGLTSNPYDSRRTAGGSSGGEGSIISAAGSVIGIGSDITGSIRMPACFNGIFSHHPTPGTVPLTGIELKEFEKLTSLLTIGPLCRYAEDIRLILKGIMKFPFKLKLDLRPDISSLKIYYIEDFSNFFLAMAPVCKEAKKSLHKTINHLEMKYSIKAEKLSLPNFPLVSSIVQAVMVIESQKIGFSVSKTLKNEKILGKIVEAIKSILGCSKYAFTTLLLAIVEDFAKFMPNRLLHFYRERNILKEILSKKLSRDGIIVMPTFPLPVPYPRQALFQFPNVPSLGIFNVLGFPATQCPLGLDANGLPTGIQVISNANNDHLCLTVAEELQDAFGGWVSPSEIKI